MAKRAEVHEFDKNCLKQAKMAQIYILLQTTVSNLLICQNTWEKRFEFDELSIEDNAPKFRQK